MAEETKLIFDVSQVLSAMDAISAEISRLESDLDGLAANVKQAFDPKALEKYADSAGLSADEIEKLQSKLDDADKSAQKISGRKFLGSDVIRNLQVGGKSLGEWSDSLDGVGGKLGSAASGTTKLSAAQKILNLIIKASPIGFLIGLVISIISYFSKWQSGIDKVSQVTAAFSAVVDELIQRYVKLIGAFVKFVTGDFDGAFNDVKEAVSGVGQALVDAAVNAYKLEQRIQALRDANLTASVTTERQRNALAELAQVYDDEAKSYGSRVRAAKQAAAIEKQLAEDAFDRALEARQIALEQFQQNVEIADKKEALAQAEADLLAAQRNLSESAFGAEQRLRSLRSKAADERKKQLEKELADLEKLAESLQKLKLAVVPEGIERDLAQVEKRYDDLAAEAQKGIDKLNEIEAKRGLTPQQQQQLQQLADIQVQIEEQRFSAILDVLEKYNEQELKLNEEQIKAKEALAQKEAKTAVDALKQEKEARDAAIKLQEERGNRLILVAQKTGVKQEEIEKTKRAFQLATQKARLESELQFQQQLLAITDAGDTAQVNSIKQKIALIQEQLKTLNIDINTPDFQQKKPKSLLELLGVDLKDVPLVEEATKKIINSLQQITAARVEAAAAAVSAADQQVQAAEDALQQEIELADAGFANNVEARKRELESAKESRKQALAEQKEAQRQQLLIDSAIQASNIITSTTNLIKSWSSIPFGIGLLAAAAQIAAIFALMASIRSRAKAISSSKARYGKEGFLTSTGIVDGKTHSQGGEKLEVERGELVQVVQDGSRKKVHVVRRENARKYNKLLTAANEGKDEAVIRAAFEMADFKKLPPAMQQQVLHHYLEKYGNGIDISTAPGAIKDVAIASSLDSADLAKTTASVMAPIPEVSRKKVAKRIERASKSGAVNVNVDSSKTNMILQQMLAVMIKQSAKPAETWTPDGKTRIRGGVVTNFKK